MSQTSPITGNQLTDALRAWGVNFILGGDDKNKSLRKQPVRLIAALAESNEARLRLSLIPLFLERPELAAYVQAAVRGLNPFAQLTLRCYYSAAVWLERKYPARGPSLPDYFSKELNLIPTNDPEVNLRMLAKRHEDLSGARVNWLGTYQHAAQIWIRGMELSRG